MSISHTRELSFNSLQDRNFSYSEKAVKSMQRSTVSEPPVWFVPHLWWMFHIICPNQFELKMCWHKRMHSNLLWLFIVRRWQRFLLSFFFTQSSIECITELLKWSASSRVFVSFLRKLNLVIFDWRFPTARRSLENVAK